MRCAAAGRALAGRTELACPQKIGGGFRTLHQHFVRRFPFGLARALGRCERQHGRAGTFSFL